MLEKLRNMLSEREEEIVERMDVAVEKKKEEAKSEVNEYFKELERTSKIVLPVNLLEILAKGGYVRVHEIDILDTVGRRPEPYRLELYSPGAHRAFEMEINVELNSKYRVVVIVEKVEKVKVEKEVSE